MLLTMPGMPCLYYGSEWGIEGEKNWNDTNLRKKKKKLQSNELTQWIKRLIDITGALVGLLITGIALIFVGPAIKIASPGPIFFKQKRVGKNGRIFYMYKFRSMYLDAEERKKERFILSDSQKAN